MLRIGTWSSAGSLDMVVCGWHDGGPGPLQTGIKLIYGVGGPMPDLPGLRVGTLVATCAEEIAEALFQGIDVVATAPDCCPAAPVVAAGMWHYGWTGSDPGALAGATAAGLAMAARPGPCAVEVRRDGRSRLLITPCQPLPPKPGPGLVNPDESRRPRHPIPSPVNVRDEERQVGRGQGTP
jgi:hypothetical protein